MDDIRSAKNSEMAVAALASARNAMTLISTGSDAILPVHIGEMLDVAVERVDNVHRAIQAHIPDLHQSSWSRNWKPFYELLIDVLHKCERQAAVEFEKGNKMLI